MAVETADDRTALLADFGVSATYTPAGGQATAVTVIFDSDFQEADAGGSITFAIEIPRVLAKTADFASAAEGDSLVIGGVTYTILVVMPDGQGMTELRLEKQ
jgi:hypothetical protein